MSNYVIFTDSACDIKEETLQKWGVKYCALTFTFSDDEKQYSNYDLTAKDFYEKMRNGAIAKTAAANTEVFTKMFELELKKGNDILYLGFSSGLSTTYNCARMAGEELREKYPDRKIITVDTLSASAGFGLMLYLTVRKKEEGATIEEAAAYTESLLTHLCHWFTVDDLVYLKRGGRISPAVALVGSVFGIKPVLHMDNEGHLISRFKVRGRKAAIKALADKFGELVDTNGRDHIFISHGDCMEDALALKTILGQTYGVDVELIADIGPVIGAHSGPGTLALFFLGKTR